MLTSNDYVTTSAGGSSGQVPLFWWQGWSTHWYVTSVYGLAGFACDGKGAFVVARREASGRRCALMTGVALNVAEELYTTFGTSLMQAIKQGANEVHVHLAADTLAQHEAAMEDIARGWKMPVIRHKGYAYA